MSDSSPTHVQCPVLVLTLTDEQVLGDDMADAIRDRLLAAAVQAEAKNVVLDFSRVSFLSSAGFRPLLSLHRLLRQNGGRLMLCSLTPEVREIFEVTRLISSKGIGKAPFEVQADIPAAVAALSKPEQKPA